MDYWKECVAEALEDAALEATEAQIDTIVFWVKGAHENYGLSHGYDAIPNPLASELAKTQNLLEIERSKVVCPSCLGSGSTISHGPHHSSYSQCYRCRGEGKVVA